MTSKIIEPNNLIELHQMFLRYCQGDHIRTKYKYSFRQDVDEGITRIYQKQAVQECWNVLKETDDPVLLMASVGSR